LREDSTFQSILSTIDPSLLPPRKQTSQQQEVDAGNHKDQYQKQQQQQTLTNPRDQDLPQQEEEEEEDVGSRIITCSVKDRKEIESRMRGRSMDTTNSSLSTSSPPSQVLFLLSLSNYKNTDLPIEIGNRL